MEHATDVDMVDIVQVDSDEDIDVIGRDDVSNYNPDNVLPQAPEVIREIRKWLQPTPYLHEGGEYRRHLASHAEGTGQWLTATENYQKWHSGRDSGLLWIKGIPGSGKSVFAATLADALASEGHPVLFFFFRQIIDANHEPVHLLRDWLDQVLEYSPPLQRDLKAYVDEKHQDLNRELESLGLAELWKHLKTALAHLPRVYLVADALDEMDRGNDEFIKDLARLGLWKPAEVKVLITSRPVSTVEIPLREFPALRIRLEEDLVDMDIATYVQQGLQSSGISAEDRIMIKEAVPGRANGLFLYAKLAMDAFLEPNADVRRVLETLPADLNAMYTDLLREHAQRSGVPHDIQRLLLCWVTHATRPLRLIEMAEMLRVTYSTPGYQGDLKSAKALVRVACGPLLEIHPDETVSVVHHSLTEFLLGSTRSAAPATDGRSQSFPVLMPGPTHEQLAISCIRYLQVSGCLDSLRDDGGRGSADDGSNPHKKLRLEFPFAEYACTNWPIHAAKSESAGLASAALFAALDSFLVPGKRLDAWLDIACRTRDDARGITPYHIAARYGLSQYLKNSVSRLGREGIDFVDTRRQTPLFYAAERGHAAAVKVLIDAGADPDPDNEAGLKPLHRAAAQNHPGVVAVLLAAGVRPLTEKTRERPGRWCGTGGRTVGHTPLMYACQAGHAEAVEAFLPYLKDASTLQQALDWACTAAKPNVVKLLIRQPGVDVNAKFFGCTPLFGACKQNDVESIDALLLAGADATVLCHGISPLEAFCCSPPERRHSEPAPDELKHGLDLLLRAGADIHRRNDRQQTPLHLAAGRPALIRLLLAAGADPNAESSDGSTVLHHHLDGEDNFDILKLLVEEGKADINKRRTGDEKTPLLVWLSGSCRTRPGTVSRPPALGLYIRFINEFHPDCAIADKNGDTPLHSVASLDNQPLLPELIDALLANGARIDQRNYAGNMPIHLANSASVIELLVARGADLEAKDVGGTTPLMVRMKSASFSNIRQLGQDIDHLVRLGAKLDTRDFRGRTLLHVALSMPPRSRRRAEDVLQLVLNLGLDLRQVDYAGNTVLHELMHAPGNSAPFFEDLIRRGVDPDAANYAGRTVLHLLSGWKIDHRQTGKYRKLFDVVLAACKKSIDAVDNEGMRPIHVAISNGPEYVVIRLMDAGANISAPTKEGLTPLHLAARGRRSNIVGMLLTAIKTTAEHKDAAGAAINAIDGKGRTPLYYACSSGRPESVALLLEAGAEVKWWTTHLLEACSQFEQDDDGRTDGSNPFDFSSLALPVHACFSARLDEILHMLVDHGLDLSGNLTYLDRTIDKLFLSNSDYTVRCFLKLRADAGGDVNVKKGPKEVQEGLAFYPDSQLVVFFNRRCAEIRREAAKRVFQEADFFSRARGDYRKQEKLLVHLLCVREFDLVEEACKLGGFDPFSPSISGLTILHGLVALGHTSLLAKIATRDHVKRLDDVEWRKADGTPDMPLVLAACKRELSNMDVLRFLVEEMDASVDACQLKPTYQSAANGKAEIKYVPGNSPLHVLARGEWWWQVQQALPYLLSRNPDLEARNDKGETPLHRALEKSDHHVYPFQKQAAKLLIAAGADVDAVTSDGKTCLAMAGNDIELVRLLIAKGAKVTAPAVFAAIDGLQVSFLDALLSAGGDVDPELLYLKPKGAKSTPVGEMHALLRAADRADSHETKQRRAEMVAVLLARGADPFAKFRTPINANANNESPESAFREDTVIHQLLLRNGIIEPFLKLPALDLERRDGVGRTLLLAACANHKTFCRTISLDDGQESQMLIDVLLQRGADTSTRDNHGRNALHHVFNTVKMERNIDTLPPDFANPLRLLLAADPSLVTQADTTGATPLHYALNALGWGPNTRRGERWADRPNPAVAAADEVVSLLLAAGADPRAVDNDGNTALHFVARSLGTDPRSPALFRRFLAFGLDVNARNTAGETPVFGLLEGIFMEKRHRQRYGYDFDEEDPEEMERRAEDEAWRVLEEAVADLRVRDSKGRNLLHVAAERNELVDVFRRLVGMGLDPLVLDEKQRTSLDVAAACGNGKVLEMFEREGAAGKKRRRRNSAGSLSEQEGLL